LSPLKNSPPQSPHRRHRALWVRLMVLIGTSLLIGSMIGLCVARAAPPASSGINDDWRVWGDVQARPVQAFDNGRALYLQLRNPSEPPAVMGPSGPLAYSMHGPYMVLPIVPWMHLKYGPYQATVQSTGTTEVMPGVVSVTAPVEVPLPGPTPVLPTPAVPLPHTVQVPVLPVSAKPVEVPRNLYSNITSGAPNTVSGQIVATSAAGRTASSGNFRADPGVGDTNAGHAFTYADAKAASMWDGRRDKQWVIRADGTTAGARAALESQTACQSAKATCTIEYRGAPAGTLVITEKNA